MTLAVIETHPVQYHAPVYRALEQDFGIPVTAVYGSDFSIAGYRDPEFATRFAWDTDLLSGYRSVFLSRVVNGGARDAHEVSNRGLAHALRELNPRAVLLVGYSPRFYQLSCLVALMLRRPLLFRAETSDHAVHRQPFKAWVRDTLVRGLYAQCARLLYIGRRSYEHFKRLGCADEKLIFSPYCVDTSAFQTDEPARRQLRGATRRELNLTDDTFVVLLSGKLVRRKAPDLVLRAIKQLSDDLRARVHVVALGAGDQEATLEQLAREQPAVRFTCPGFQNQTRLSGYYHAADVLVLPSQSDETWGLVVNEALHHGLPCIVSDAVGCAPDLIETGKTGEIFQSGSASALAHALQRCLVVSGSEAVRSACRARVSQYTVAHSAAGIARGYAAVA